MSFFRQTPEEWDDLTNDKKKKGHKRSTSLGNKDELKEVRNLLLVFCPPQTKFG